MINGRPTKYNENILTKVESYLEMREDSYEVAYKPRIKDGVLQETDEAYLKYKLPSIEDLALFLEVNRDTLYEWEKEHEEFSDILGKVRAKQATELINGGVNGNLNPTIAKVLLTKHGYREGLEQSGVDGQPLVISFDSTFNKNASTTPSTTESNTE